MGDDQDKPGSAATPEKPPKIKANDNPWYLLATLYGEPADEPDYKLRKELQDRNRVAWNRYYSSNVDDNIRCCLIDKNNFSQGDFAELRPNDLRDFEQAFLKRSGSEQVQIPNPTKPVNFSETRFEKCVCFKKYIFWRPERDTTVSSTNVLFTGAIFSAVADFRGASFVCRTDFKGTTFEDYAKFECAIFHREATFEDATFQRRAQFTRTGFASTIRFKLAKFKHPASFKKAYFCGIVKFNRVTFESLARFTGAKFPAPEFTRIDFVNAEFNSKTWFDSAEFNTRVPEFFGAKLHEGTDWPDYKTWPIPTSKDVAKNFVRAYERLKLEMDRLKKHEDELNFFALELRSRRVMLGLWEGLPIDVFGALSDYGRNYWWPLIWLVFGVVPFGAGAFWLFGDLIAGRSFALSAANTLNVFGFRKDFVDQETLKQLAAFPAGLKVLSGVQTILGGVLLFLFGLGIRNRFRMK